ncbi:MAG: type II toxin-antitoxin system VapC family toxin [Candidatus Aenigmatarchaeota archaeon]
MKENKKIDANITIVNSIEYPPVLTYEKFEGEIYTISPDDQILALRIQRKLRKVGKPKSVPDILIASISINRDEKLYTNDDDFEDIENISQLEFYKS